MKSVQGPDDHLYRDANYVGRGGREMGDTISDRVLKDIFVQGFSSEYESIKIPNQVALLRLYLDNLFHKTSDRNGWTAGRSVAISL